MSSGGPEYRPTNDDAPHVALFLLAAALCVGWAGLDRLAGGGGRGVHLACLALAGLSAGTVVFEAAPVMRQARSVAIGVAVADAMLVAGGVALHRGAVPVVCGVIGLGLAAAAVCMMRGPIWVGYMGSVRQKR